MKKLLITSIILLGPLFSILSSTGYAASNDFTQSIRGIVTDAVTGYPLIGANVILLNSNPLVGTITNENGHFELLAIPIGRQNLEVSYVGYYNKIIPNILLTSGKEVVLQIRLEEKAIEMEEVVIKAGRRKDQAINEMATVSARTFSVEETERFA